MGLIWISETFQIEELLIIDGQVMKNSIYEDYYFSLTFHICALQNTQN